MYKSQILDAFNRQVKYSNTTNFTSFHLKAILSYVVEETVEINRELTSGNDRYKLFKPSQPVNPAKLADELADLYIHCMNALAVSGIPPEDLISAYESKINFNKTRVDHELPVLSN
jgi:phosphoribosyl-ATP pyrophosphohydrolase